MKTPGLAFLNSGSKRSISIKKNVVASFMLKGLSIGVSLLLVPMTLNYLDKEKYGLWLTLSSLISWFSLFDIGLGNGFRNKFAEANTNKDLQLAKTYVSTTFALIAIIIAAVFLLFLIAQPFLNWSKILNAPAADNRDLSLLAIIVFTFFCLQFIFKLTTTILLADQKAAWSDFIGVLGSLLSLASVYALINIAPKGSLLMLGLVVSACPVLVLIAAYFAIFNGKYSAFKPKISFIKFKYSKDLLSLGLHFFVAQIAALVVFSTSNIVISHLLSPAEVPAYNVAFKYFSVLTLIFQIILTPFWSAYTEAYIMRDTVWIKKSIKKLTSVWGLTCLLSGFMLLISNWVYHVWMGNSIKVPFTLSLSFAIYVCIGNWNQIFVSFNFGASKVRIQLWLSALAGIINIPLTIFFIKLAGLPGDVIGMVLAIIPGSFISPIQYYKLINGKAKGIWNK